MTGPLNAKRAGQLGGALSAQTAGLVHGWVRYWVSGITGQQVIEFVFNAGNRGGAGEASAAIASSMSARGTTHQQLTATSAGYTSLFGVDGRPYTLIATPLARGPFLFVLEILAPAQSTSADSSLLVDLATVQERKVPANTPDTGTSLADLQPDPYNAAGPAVGALLGYLAIVSGIAWLRNPLRRKRRGERSAGPAGATRRPARPGCVRTCAQVSEHRAPSPGGPARRPGPHRLRRRSVPGLELVSLGAGRSRSRTASGRFIRPAGLAPGATAASCPGLAGSGSPR